MFVPDIDYNTTLNSYLMVQEQLYQNTTSELLPNHFTVWHYLGTHIIPAEAHLHNAKNYSKVEIEHPLAKFLGTWKGDDASEVLAMVKNSRSTF